VRAYGICIIVTIDIFALEVVLGWMPACVAVRISGSGVSPHQVPIFPEVSHVGIAVYNVNHSRATRLS
jgi:hypothetical protein